MLFTGSLSGGEIRVRRFLPFLQLPFFTASATAWLIQDHRWSGVPSSLRRFCDALVIGLGWFAASLLGYAIKAWIEHKGFGWAQVSTSMLGLAFGGALGLIVPGSFRENVNVLVVAVRKLRAAAIGDLAPAVGAPQRSRG